MGKIILTERQYRNLNQILIGKEIENNKGRLNEGYEMASDGLSFTTNDDIGLSDGKIKSGAKLMIDSSNDIICNKCKYENKDGAVSTPSIRYNCSEKHFRIGDNIIKIYESSNTKLGFEALCKKRNSREFNWGGDDFMQSFNEPNRYWDTLTTLLKPYGFIANDVTISGVDAGPGLINKSKKLFIVKDYNANNGYNIIHSETNSYKFTEYGNTYGGQSLDTTIIVDKNGVRSTLLKLVGAATPSTPSTPATPETPATPGKLPLTYEKDAGASWTPTQIFVFQQWYWNKKEINLPLISGTEGDSCTAKYASALCGGKACLVTKACDGKLGSNTKSLITDSNVDEFSTWLNANITDGNRYLLPFKKCSSAEKGYTASVKTPSSTSRRSSTGGGGGGTGGGGTGGGSTGGGGTGAHELSGLV